MNSKSGFDLLFYHRPGTLQASKLSFALIQFHLNEFENMMLLILEQLLLKLFSINRVVLTKNLFNKFWVEHNKEIVLGHAFIKKPVARKSNFFLRKYKTKQTFSLKGYPNAVQKPARINMTYIDPKKRLPFTEFFYSPYKNKKNPRIF